MASSHRIIIRNARILTLAGSAEPRRGPTRDVENPLGAIPAGWMAIAGERIEEVGAGEPPFGAAEVVDAGGCVVMPGFVDCHTHACWAGDRFDEADLRLAGVPYLEILARGGGIMSTVRATRAASLEDLAAATSQRFRAALSFGTTTIEAKSGYGLSLDDELKMLRAIRLAAERTPQRVVATFLGAHAKDPANERYVDDVVEEMLPLVLKEFPGIACDAYCERGAWSREECERLFAAAKTLGSPIRVHADQFNPLGMTTSAIRLGARSVDHLEASTDEELAALAASSTVGVALPGCGFHLDNRFAKARALLDAGGALALATNCNPGSSPTVSIPFIIALAVRFLRVTPAEAILATTVNAAHVLGLGRDVGRLVPGMQADLQMLPTRDERTLAYEYANPGPTAVWIRGGRVIGHATSE
jgi:imidazolonepropionase